MRGWGGGFWSDGWRVEKEESEMISSVPSELASDWIGGMGGIDIVVFGGEMSLDESCR